jgi:hypothetical protein
MCDSPRSPRDIPSWCHDVSSIDHPKPSENHQHTSALLSRRPRPRRTTAYVDACSSTRWCRAAIRNLPPTCYGGNSQMRRVNATRLKSATSLHRYTPHALVRIAVDSRHPSFDRPIELLNFTSCPLPRPLFGSPRDRASCENRMIAPRARLTMCVSVRESHERQRRERVPCTGYQKSGALLAELNLHTDPPPLALWRVYPRPRRTRGRCPRSRRRAVDAR